MTYISEFIERNEQKSFVTNLKKYNILTEEGKKKVISSFFTHLIIDAENGVDNQTEQEDILGILCEITFYKQDKFLDWLQEKI